MRVVMRRSREQPHVHDDGGLLVLAPMAIEARAIRAGAPWTRVEKIGMGPRRARAAASLGGERHALIAGICGALDESLEPGDVILASELRTPERTLPCPDPTVLAGVLRRGGLRVHIGPILSSTGLIFGERRRELALQGALAVDMESAWLADEGRAAPLTTLRVVLDTPRHEFHRPARAAVATRRAFRALREASSLLEGWAGALAQREVVLAAPRASCAGVTRAVEIVERALEQRGAPVYVRKQIVHNAHVVGELERRGAVFVDDVDEVPQGATVIFSAHGVSPAVRRHASDRDLDVIDATCPLVAKVHAEARRFAAGDYQIVLVGHEDHEEVEGTVGEAPAHTQVIASIEEARTLELDDPDRVAVLTQTTLAVDETADIVDVLRGRFPSLVSPPSEDICYATQNRQDAVRAIAQDVELILVVGSENSSNSRRLVEVAQRAGARAMLLERAEDLEPETLAGVSRVGVTAGASAPESLVQHVVRAIDGLGGAAVREVTVATEDMHFNLPPQVRPQVAAPTPQLGG
ncbi:MAG TPA: 4-hydroxy-3-methylbut-2-enyl diphosphate reductase [Solirubrobacteraceae bacterium]|nr:4-hydroxy-3-methylbut-2-enyl diphosphate reductase [Solirubrobacteraceae bacterium]